MARRVVMVHLCLDRLEAFLKLTFLVHRSEETKTLVNGTPKECTPKGARVHTMRTYGPVACERHNTDDRISGDFP